jgi:hypothetical protein
MSGVKVDFQMFSDLDLQIVNLKHQIKRDTSSFNMRETYPKIPRLFVKVCRWNKPQMVEALLDVTFTVQISTSAGNRIDDSTQLYRIANSLILLSRCDFSVTFVLKGGPNDYCLLAPIFLRNKYM